MLKIICDSNHSTIESSGSTFDLVCELSLAIHKIYRAFEKSNPKNAESFRLAMRAALMDGSPVWDKDKVPMEKVVCLSRDPSEPIKVKDIQEMIRNGATPEQIARYCGGVE